MFDAVADTYVNQSSPTASFGSSPDLLVRRFENTAVYLRFNLSGFPTAHSVNYSELRVQAYRGFAWGDDGNVYVRFVENDGWPESITYDTRPAVGRLLGFWWLHYDATPADRVGVLRGTDLDAYIRRERMRDSSLSVSFSSTGYDTDYRSREYGVAAQRPVLDVYHRALMP